MAHHMNTDMPPGTVHLVDLQGTLNAKHDDGAKDVVLFPQPSNSFNDPLNWSKSRKRQVGIMLLLVCVSGCTMTTLLSVALLDIEKNTGISLATLNSGVGVQYLFYGWSNVLWQPLGLTYGRRPVFLFAAVCMLACSVWTSYVKTAGEWYANRLLIGAFYGPIETLIEVCIADVFFTHQRGFWVSMYCWILYGYPFIGGMPTGYITVHLGWEWIQFIASIVAGAIIIGMFFFLEETMFYREPQQVEALGIEENASTRETSLPGEKSAMSKEQPVTPQVEIGEDITETPFLQKLKFWGARTPGEPNNFWRSVYMPFVLIRYPVIFFSSVLVGSVLSWFNVVNATMALVLTQQPYNFSTEAIGLFFIAPFIGCTIGCVFDGLYSDRLVMWLSRRKGGVFEPEYRLWMIVIPLILHPVGCILFGVGANHGIHWVGLAFGMAIVVGMIPICASIAINYIIDSYKEISGDGMVTMILVRNSMGFGFSYGVTPWIQASGVQNTYIAVGFLGMFFSAISFVFIVYGKGIRKASAVTYWTMVEKQGFKAH